MWRKLNNYTYLARSLIDLGSVYSRQGEFALAQKAHEEAGEIIKPTNNIKEQAYIYQQLGILYYRQEKWVEAETAFLHLSPIALRELKEFDLLAGFYNNLGNVYLKMAQWDKSREYLIQAIEILRHINNKLDLGNSLGTLATVYKQIGEKEKALQGYEEAISLLYAFPESQWAQKLLGEFVPEYEELRTES